MKKIIGVLLIIAALMIAGCGTSGNTEKKGAGAGQEKAASSAKTLTLGWQDAGYPSPFAFNATGPGGFLRNSFLFDTLTWKDSKGVIPWLAKSWSVSKDGKAYTFQLEKGVKWHDGKPFTADDVVFSFNYYKKHPFNWTGDVSRIQSVEKLGADKVVFNLNKPYAAFLSELVGIVPVIPKHVWKNVDDPVKYRGKGALVGTGPYVLKKYDASSGQYLFTANKDYFKGKVKVQEIKYVNTQNSVLSLQNHEINAGMTFVNQDVQQLKQKGFDVLQSKPTGSAVRIVFNMKNSQLKDKRLLQAIAYALDRKTIGEKLIGGNFSVGSAGVIPPDSPWYNSKVKKYDYSVEKADQLLDKLGYHKNAKGIRAKLNLHLLAQTGSKEPQMMQEMLKKVGIQLNVQMVDPATFTQAMGENKYDMALTGHIGFSGDPDYLRTWLAGKASNTLAARGEPFANAKFQKLAEAQSEEMNHAKRKAEVDQMQDILADELPTLILYHRPFYFVYKKSDFSGWFNTYEGIADGIPLWDNKAALVDEKK